MLSDERVGGVGESSLESCVEVMLGKLNFKYELSLARSEVVGEKWEVGLMLFSFESGRASGASGGQRLPFIAWAGGWGRAAVCAPLGRARLGAIGAIGAGAPPATGANSARSFAPGLIEAAA